MEKQKREEEERETLLRIAKVSVCACVCIHGDLVKISNCFVCFNLFSPQSRLSSEDPEQLRLKQKAKEVCVCVCARACLSIFLLCCVGALRVPQDIHPRNTRARLFFSDWKLILICI